MTKEKETLQAKDIVGYIANGGLIAKVNSQLMHFSFRDVYQRLNVDFVEPCLYPLSHLTKEILLNGGRIVPLIECAKVAFTGYEWEVKSHNVVVSGNREFVYYKESKSFACYINVDAGKAVPNQYALFQLLYQYKIDFLGLIDKGLAVDVSTLEINPYK